MKSNPARGKSVKWKEGAWPMQETEPLSLQNAECGVEGEV